MLFLEIENLFLILCDVEYIEVKKYLKGDLCVNSNFSKLPHHVRKWYAWMYMVPLILILVDITLTECLKGYSLSMLFLILYGISCFFSTKATNGRKQWIILDTIIYLFLLLVVFIFYR